jgi:signal transduction histidine kinase
MAPLPGTLAVRRKRLVFSPMANVREAESVPGRRLRAADRALAYLTRTPDWGWGWSVAIIASLVLMIGWVDYVSGPHISLRVFYDLPIALAAAWLGWRAAVATSVGSVATWLASDYFAGAEYVRRPEIPWNAAIALSMYLVFVWILTAFIRLHRRLEHRVLERTLALEQEVTSRARLQRELLTISERERSLIGNDLHDGLCQHLAGTAMAAQVLAEDLHRREDRAAGEARRIVQLVEEGIAQTRHLANGLLLAAIKPDRLPAELEKLAMSVSEHHGIACRLVLGGEPHAPNERAASHLFRIAQEAVRNAVKHAHPKHVDIVLAADGRTLTLTVSDDGSGLPRRRRGPGMGLRIMAHRAEMIRGEFAVESGSSGGTRVRCRIPAHLKTG